MCPQTVCGWLEDEDRSGAAKGITALSDVPFFTTSGDNLQFRSDIPKVGLAYVWTEFAAYAPNRITLTGGEIAGNPQTFTKGVALNYLSPGQVYDFRSSPLEYPGLPKPGTNVTVTGYEEDEAGVAHYLALMLIMTNAPIPIRDTNPPPITHLHHCTATATTAATWTTLALVETNGLTAGRYAFQGARVEHATAIAARFKIPGHDLKPAVIPVSRAADPVHPFSRYWGKEYEFTMPGGMPTIDILEVTGSGAIEIEMYLRKVG